MSLKAGQRRPQDSRAQTADRASRALQLSGWVRDPEYVTLVVELLGSLEGIYAEPLPPHGCAEGD